MDPKAILSAFSPIKSALEGDAGDCEVKAKGQQGKPTEETHSEKENLRQTPLAPRKMPRISQSTFENVNTLVTNTPKIDNTLQTPVAQSASTLEVMSGGSATNTPVDHFVQDSPLLSPANSTNSIQVKLSNTVLDPQATSAASNSRVLCEGHSALEEVVRRVVREELEGVKELLQRDIRNLHVDMLRGNTVLERSTERIMSRHLPTIGELLKELDDLRNENKRLKLFLNQ